MSIKFEIKLLPNPEQLQFLGAAQRETLEVLTNLLGESYSLVDLMALLRLSSPLPLWARLRRLESKGFLSIVDLTTANF